MVELQDRLDEIRDLIARQLPDAQVEVWDLRKGHEKHHGAGREHLGMRVASSAFEGKNRLQQHRMVMDILKSEFGGQGIHAVQLKTLTPQQLKE